VESDGALSNELEQFHDSPDTECISLEFGEVLPYAVVAAPVTTRLYQAAYSLRPYFAATWATGKVEAANPRSYERRAIEHENEHTQAAKYLGATATRCGLAFRRFRESADDTEGTLQLNSFMEWKNPQQTKLELALVIARPTRLSPGDLEQIAMLGYDGVWVTWPSGNTSQ
jgi:hypothetical protein